MYLSSAVSFGVGSLKFDNIVGKMLAHGISQGAMTAAQGGKFQHGFFSAAFSAGLAPSIQNSAKSKIGQVFAASIVGGTASVLGGGKFANGAITGAFVMLFNEMMHQKDGNAKSKEPTLQEQLEAKLKSTPIGGEVSGKELSFLDKDAGLAVDKIVRVSDTKFEVKSTIVGKLLIKKGAYIEIIPNQSISGDFFDRGNQTFKGVLINTYGLPAQEIGTNRTNIQKVTSFIINGDFGYYRVNNTTISSFRLLPQ